MNPPSHPLRLRRFTRNESQAYTLLATRALNRTAPLGGSDWTISVEPLADEPVVGATDWRIEARWAGARVAITLPDDAPGTWTRARFPDLDLPALPPAFATAILEEAVGDALGAVRALDRGAVQFERMEKISTARAGASLEHHFALTLRQGEQVLYGTLACDPLGLMLMAGIVSRQPTVPNALDEDSLPIPLRAEIGRTSLPADRLASLTLHDTILIEHAWISQGKEIWLGQDAFGIRVRWDDTQLTITHVLTAETGLTMSTQETPAPQNAAPNPLDKIPVQITFDLGERSLTLAELKSLQPGQVLDLGRPLSAAVNIRANGAWIGSGELVEVDGHLGVTITSLAEKHG